MANDNNAEVPVTRVESCSVSTSAQIQNDWLDLQSRSDCSYFQSWGWIRNWLERIAGDLEPVVIRVWSGQRVIGIGLFVARDLRRHILIRSKAMFLNEYPFDSRNMVIEYNGLLAERGCAETVYDETIRHLIDTYDRCDEFHFGAIEDGENLDALARSVPANLNFIHKEQSVTWQLDLDQLQPGLDGYLNSLGKNRKAQVRRSISLYRDRGQLELTEAATTQQALAMFDELKVLHTRRWQSKGKGGAFANSRWEDFHRALIRDRFQKGEIQLLKVAVDDETIGCLYNYLWRRRVYVMQTGFSSSGDKRLMPGYVVHGLSIVHNKKRGFAVYDLMHGDSLYKRMICNRNSRLNWLVVQNRKLRFAFEKLAVGLIRRYRSCRF